MTAWESTSVCRGYIAFLASPLINYNDALAFIPAVPLAMRQIVAGIQAALIAVRLLSCGFQLKFTPGSLLGTLVFQCAPKRWSAHTRLGFFAALEPADSLAIPFTAR